jgi:hypothetical protein
MTDELKTSLQNQPASPPVEPTVNAPIELNAPAVVPAPTTPEPSAPPQAEIPKPKGKDAQARINELVAKVKMGADENEHLHARIQQLESSPGAGGPEGTAPVVQPENPYAPVGIVPTGEVTQEDLEAMSPVERKNYNDLQVIIKERDNAKAETAWTEAIAANYEAYPELEGIVDDHEIGLEMSKKRVPIFNAGLVFAGRTVDVLRAKVKDLETENATLKTELHKDEVASPSSGSLQPAPPDKIDRVYAPGERMAEAKQKAAAKG